MPHWSMSMLAAYHFTPSLFQNEGNKKIIITDISWGTTLVFNFQFWLADAGDYVYTAPV